MSTNDTVLLLASGATGVAPGRAELAAAVEQVCADLARQLVADAEGATKDIAVDGRRRGHRGRRASTSARAVARSNLLKCAIHGEDPNWGRVLAAVGTTDAAFEPDRLAVAINGVLGLPRRARRPRTAARSTCPAARSSSSSTSQPATPRRRSGPTT